MKNRSVPFFMSLGNYRILLLVPFLLFAQGTTASEDPIPFDQLVDDLGHPDAERRWNAIDALGASTDRRAVPHLITALKKDIKQRRGFAMAIIPALGRLGDERAVPILIETLDNREEDWLGREVAARALGDIGSVKAVPSLIRAAWAADTRSAAIEALAAIADPRALDVLLSALDEPEDEEVRQVAVDGLVCVGGSAVPKLIDKLETHSKEYPAIRERALAAEVLGRIGDRRAIGPLTKALGDTSAEVRNSAKGALKLLRR